MHKKLKKLADGLAITAFLFIAALVLAKYLPGYQHLTRRVEDFVGGYRVLHWIVGGALTLALAWLSRLYRRSLSMQAIFFILLLTAYGVDEWMQGLVSHRHSCLSDFLDSARGWTLAVLIWLAVSLLLSHKENARQNHGKY